MDSDQQEGASGLIDVSGMTLSDLREWGDSSLVAELRRALGPDSGDDNGVARFSNSV